MQLVLLRHGIAVERGTPGYERDSERPLTPKGRKRLRAVAAGMQALGLDFDLILTSPYVRARETAAIVADAFGAGARLVVTPSLAADRDPEDVVQELRERADLPDRVLLVGHEPVLSLLISLLLSGDDGLPVTMKKGGACCLSITTLTAGRCASLEWLAPPRLLAGLA